MAMTRRASATDFTKKLRKQRIEDIIFFVRDRTDGPENLKLPSLNALSDADLQWLAAAIDNCSWTVTRQD